MNSVSLGHLLSDRSATVKQETDKLLQNKSVILRNKQWRAVNDNKHVDHISSSCSCRAGVFLSESSISAALAKRVSELHSGTFQSDRSLDIIPVSWVVGRSLGEELFLRSL